MGTRVELSGTKVESLGTRVELLGTKVGWLSKVVEVSEIEVKACNTSCHCPTMQPGPLHVLDDISPPVYWRCGLGDPTQTIMEHQL